MQTETCYVRMYMRKLMLILLFAAFVSLARSQDGARFVDFINQPHEWVDSVFQTMTPRERVGQLFMVRAHSNLGQRYIDSVAGVIEREQLGGIVLFQGGPVGHAQVINQYQQLSKVPLLVAFDGEWGLGMRLADSTVSYPYQMTLGAISNEELIYEMGREVGRDFRRLGMHVNFAPVIDVNNNPDNPVINFRSFGEDKFNVTRKGRAYMQGMMDEGIIATLKHFPGHGDTDVDSHHDLPVLPFSVKRLDTLEIHPFRELIAAGAPGVMTAHMHIPSLDSTPDLPSSISRPIVNGLLKEQLGFRGLIFTDAMGMKGVVKYFPDGEADIRAILAGNDVLELSENSARAIEMVLAAIADGRIEQAEIDGRVRKILAAKYWLGLNERASATVPYRHLYDDLNRRRSKILVRQLAESAVTLLNGDRLIRTLHRHRRTAIVGISGSGTASEFQEILEKEFGDSRLFTIPVDADSSELAQVVRELEDFEQIVLSIHDTRARPRNKLDYSSLLADFIGSVVDRDALVCFFANPYALAELPGIERAGSLLVCYQNEGFMQRAAARVVLRERKARGRLPVSIYGLFKSGDGML